MEIRSFDEKLEKELLDFMRRQRLIPIIGSGFTAKSKANMGYVPTGSEMKDFMCEKIFESIGENVTGEFSTVASNYDRYVDINIRNDYLKKNFINVELDKVKINFLNIDWPYIYSLNIDDAIERASREYKIILANKDFNEEYIKQNKCLFKLHGDATDVLKYKNSDQKIFTKKEYLTSLRKNIFLLDLFKNDYTSKSLLFIGCSLDDEIDLLESILENTSSIGYKNKIYYLTHEELTKIKLGNLEDFGITDIIKIENINKYNDVYKKIEKIYFESKKTVVNELDKFKNLSVEFINKKTRIENLPYLFNSNGIFKESGKILLPDFFISREDTKNIVDNIDSFPVHIVEGNMVSGKTYCLLDILRRINDRNTYYIPSDITLNNQALENLINTKKCVILFDTNAFTNEQFKYIVNNNYKLKENHTSIIFAINTSNKEIIAEIKMEIKDNKSVINRLPLDNKFSDKEMKLINKNLSLVDIDDFENKEKIVDKKSLLDNIIRLDGIIRNKEDIEYEFKMPKLDTISNDYLIIMIILATKEKVTSYDVTIFNLVESIAEFEKTTSPATQFYYVGLYEEQNHSGYKVVANAKYWLLNTLGEYSIDHKNEIAEAYKTIAICLKDRYKQQEKRFFKEMSKYIKFDVLNAIFSNNEKKNGGSAGLIRRIYEKLHDYLCDDPQYFHQRAKSIYWLSATDKNKLKEALNFIDKALNDIEATKDITNEYTKNSLSHVEYTKALILGRLCTVNNFDNYDLTVNALKCYYKAFTNIRNRAYISDLRRNTYANKLKDFKKILNWANNNKTIKTDYRKEIGSLYEVLIKNK